MNLKYDFTKKQCNQFKENINFTRQEVAVFDLVAIGETNVEIQLRLHMSESTVNRRIRSVKDKIERYLTES